MQNIERGPVDLMTARSINQIERTGDACELCGGRGKIVAEFHFNGRKPVWAHVLCFTKRDDQRPERTNLPSNVELRDGFRWVRISEDREG